MVILYYLEEGKKGRWSFGGCLSCLHGFRKYCLNGYKVEKCT